METGPRSASPPNREAFARLRELEQKGEDVRSRLSNLYNEKIVREYEGYKAEEEESKLKSSSLSESEIDQESLDEYYFQELWLLHLRYVPVFTMLHEKNQKETADAYRAWLYARHG